MQIKPDLCIDIIQMKDMSFWKLSCPKFNLSDAL